ncbi:Clathrin heavy chain 1 [Babesia sp. Xinjiang]|uniref:Clathrin heavy chain 1 n=1 Tax=Babesia sp. Xinjiang TaxID=462227 RepID=UPI000A26048C|nr:Clathrin heavy chain 1 [Babesia sp. Xinjiang]ORM41265.1 Clathrin heavy chain 1 [Babesia sp. Xinjiang]
MAGAPLNVTTLLRLRTLGFDDSCFRFGTLTLGGDRFVCVRESDSASHSVAIIDLHKGNEVSRRPIKAESTIMNPREPIIALKASLENGHFIQVFHLETKEKLGTHQFAESVVFWSWISPTELAIVTDASVYHWTVGSGEPTLMFGRSGKLADQSTKLVHYASDAESKWCVLCGIYSTDQGATVEGAIQLYSTERRQQQLLEGYTGTFGRLRVSKESMDTTSLLVFCEHKRGAQSSKLHCMDIYTQRAEGSPPPLKVSKDIENLPSNSGDFPIFVQILDSCGFVCILTKNGFAHYHDAATATHLFSTRISDAPLFAAEAKFVDDKVAGTIAVNRSGEVIEALIDENRVLAALTCADEVRISLATRYGFPGSESLMMRSFENYFSRRDYKQAAMLVVTLKNGALRTNETMERFINAPVMPGETSPALHYFSVLLEHGKLTHQESLGLVRRVVAQGRKELVKKWLDEHKLTESEDLGDLLRPMEPLLAFKIYVSLCCHMKAILSLLEAGHATKVVPYIRKIASSNVTHTTSSTGDKVAQVEGLPSMTVIVEHMLASQPTDIVGFVNDLISGLGPGEPLCDVGSVAEILIKHNKLQELTKILLEYLKPNLEQHSALQTRLLEVNLQHQPRVADMILQLNALTHFDRAYIARLCEDAGMFDLAIQHYDSLSDVKRLVLKAGGNMNRAVLEKTLKNMTPEHALEVLREMSDSSDISNEQVVSCALTMHNHIGTMHIVQMFERSSSSEVLFSFLRALPVMSQGAAAEKNDLNATLVYKFIQCCIERGEYEDLERICKDSNCYDGVRVKELLKQSALPNPKSLLIVCHKLGELSELTEYLYRNGMEKAIEVYVNTINPGGVSTVMSTLFDLSAPEHIIHSILENLHDPNGMKAMIKVADERHQLLMLRDWLEKRVNEGYKETEIHTALAKIRVSSQEDAENFLLTNKHYDRTVIGRFCEERDPMLAYLIYYEAQLDSDVLRLCLANGFHKMLASYALKRSSTSLWRDIVVSNSSTISSDDRKRVCEELVSLAPECSNASEISCALKALLDSGMNVEVIALLEQLLLTQTQFSSSSNLQNLLLATAVKTNPAKLEEYLSKLDNYDVSALSKLSDSLGLSRSSFSILKSAGRALEALDALLSMKEDGILQEAHDYVASVDKPELWFRLGRAYLEEKNLPKAIDSYVRSGDLSDHERIKRACEGDPDLFLRWLTNGRKVKKSRDLDTDLLLCLADRGDVDQFREVLEGQHSADVAFVGSMLMNSQKYREAVIIYSSLPNYAKLAVCHVHLGDFELAADSALKSRNPQVLRQVVETCVGEGQLSIAHKVAIELLTYPDFLPGIVSLYENTGNVQELIKLLEDSSRSVAVSTELAIAIAKYRPDDLLTHFKNRFNSGDILSSLNTARVARECCNLWLWKEAVYLYSLDSPDTALLSMVAHYGLAWDEDTFFSTAASAINPEALYKAIHFCIQCKPLLLPRLLMCSKGRVDACRVVKILKNSACLGLGREYLEAVADKTSASVNDALFEVYVEEEECELLERSLERLTAFDQVALCAILEEHHLPKMRSIAAQIYTRSRNFSKSALIRRRNGDFVAAIKAVNQSRSDSLASEMVRYFVDHGLREEFVACLVVNYSLLEPAAVLELAWLRKLDLDILMPFLIQTLRDVPHGTPKAPPSQRAPAILPLNYC